MPCRVILGMGQSASDVPAPDARRLCSGHEMPWYLCVINFVWRVLVWHLQVGLAPGQAHGWDWPGMDAIHMWLATNSARVALEAWDLWKPATGWFAPQSERGIHVINAGQVFLSPHNMAVGQNQWYHFGAGAPPVTVYFSGWIGMFSGGYDLDFDPWPPQTFIPFHLPGSHFGYSFLTHGHMDKSDRSMRSDRPGWTCWPPMSPCWSGRPFGYLKWKTARAQRGKERNATCSSFRYLS